MHLLFIDPACNKPYDPGLLATQPLGGTEATVVRVAEALSAQPGVSTVHVMQHNRSGASRAGARYVGIAERLPAMPTHVVLLRNPVFLTSLRQQFARASFYFWAHDEFLWPGWKSYFQVLIDTGTLPVCVSRWHETQMQTFAQGLGFADLPSTFIYNPIADELAPDATPVDPGKLIYFSSPHKGLKNTLRAFARLRTVAELSGMHLVVANPGYHPDYEIGGLAGVSSLGSVSHGDVIREVRSAFAALHLNDVCPETFGLVNAEANAVGVPVLATPLGATAEICADDTQLVAADDDDALVARLVQWRQQGRPQVAVRPEFRQAAVTRAWLDLLGRQA